MGDTIQATTPCCPLWGWDGVMLTDGAAEPRALSREPGVRPESWLSHFLEVIRPRARNPSCCGGCSAGRQGSVNAGLPPPSHRESAAGLTPRASSGEPSLLEKGGWGPPLTGPTGSFPAGGPWAGSCGSTEGAGAQRRELDGDLVRVVSTEGFLEEGGRPEGCGCKLGYRVAGGGLRQR